MSWLMILHSSSVKLMGMPARRLFFLQHAAQRRHADAKGQVFWITLDTAPRKSLGSQRTPAQRI
jgi:hypothetical protein